MLIGIYIELAIYFIYRELRLYPSDIGGEQMDSKLKGFTMSGAAFAILFCLQEPQHGYGIGQR